MRGKGKHAENEWQGGNKKKRVRECKMQATLCGSGGELERERERGRENDGGS
jgi:hypothetical protein